MNLHVTVSLCTNIESCKTRYENCTEMIPEETFFDGAYYMKEIDVDLVEMLKSPGEKYTIEVAGDNEKGVVVDNLNLHNKNWKAIGFSTPRNENWETTRIQFTSGQISANKNNVLEISIGRPNDKTIHVCDRKKIDGRFNPSNTNFYTQDFIDDCIEGTLHFRDIVSRPPTPQHDFDYNEFRLIFNILSVFFTFYILPFIFYILHVTFYILHFTFYI